MTRSVYHKVRAEARFRSPEEGGRSSNVDLRDPLYPYELLADFGLGYTEEGLPVRCMARLELEGDPGFIELGIEQVVRVELQCMEGVVKPGARFDLAEGPKVVATATVLSVLESVY